MIVKKIDSNIFCEMIDENISELQTLLDSENGRLVNCEMKIRKNPLWEIVAYAKNFRMSVSKSVMIEP